MKYCIKVISLSLLMSSSFIAISMDTLDPIDRQSTVTSVVIQSQKSKVQLNLQDCIGAFEKSDWATSYKGFKKLCKSGGTIGTAYMQYMEECGLVVPTIQLGHVAIESIPDIALALSREYLDASLACMAGTMLQQVKKLAPLILNQNIHAIKCMVNLCAQNDGAFKVLLSHKGYRNIAKKYATPIDLFKNFIPAKGPVPFWNCIELDYIVYLHANRNQASVAKDFTALELQYLATNVKKSPQMLGKLAKKLATTNDSSQVKQPLFWAHFAVENGLGDLCGMLGKNYFDQLIQDLKNRPGAQKVYTSPTKIRLTPEAENYLVLSRYYASRVQKGDLLTPNILFGLMQSHASDYEAGAYGMLDKSKGYLFDQQAADLGSSESQYNVAVRFEYGNGVVQDWGKALEYYSLAAAQNNIDALFNLGAMFQKGKGTEPNLERALYFLKRAEDLGDDEAKHIRISLSKDLEELRGYADQGDVEAQMKYAAACFELANQSLTLEEKNHYYQKTRQYLEKAASQDHANAICHLATLLYWGQGGTPHFTSARENFRKAADLGVREAQYNYAVMALKGEGGDINLPEARKYFSKAADKGMIEAFIGLREMEEQELNKPNTIMEQNILGSTNQEDIIRIALPPLSEDHVVELPVNADLGSKNIDSQNSQIPQIADQVPEGDEVKLETNIDTSNLKEIEQSLIKHRQEINELRAKKHAQKRVKEHSKQTFTMKRKDYDKINTSGVLNTGIHNEKTSVAHETLVFVKTIFGTSTQKINAYSLQAAQQAFFDLGCEVSSKKGENSTKIKFFLKGVGTLKYKFHNPHGQGGNLYDALKPYMRRFLEAINKTPNTLVIKRG